MMMSRLSEKFDKDLGKSMLIELIKTCQEIYNKTQLLQIVVLFVAACITYQCKSTGPSEPLNEIPLTASEPSEPLAFPVEFGLISKHHPTLPQTLKKFYLAQYFLQQGDHFFVLPSPDSSDRAPLRRTLISGAMALDQHITNSGLFPIFLRSRSDQVIAIFEEKKEADADLKSKLSPQTIAYTIQVGKKKAELRLNFFVDSKGFKLELLGEATPSLLIEFGLKNEAWSTLWKQDSDTVMISDPDQNYELSYPISTPTRMYREEYVTASSQDERLEFTVKVIEKQNTEISQAEKMDQVFAEVPDCQYLQEQETGVRLCFHSTENLSEKISPQQNQLKRLSWFDSLEKAQEENALQRPLLMSCPQAHMSASEWDAAVRLVQPQKIEATSKNCERWIPHFDVKAFEANPLKTLSETILDSEIP